MINSGAGGGKRGFTIGKDFVMAVFHFRSSLSADMSIKGPKWRSVVPCVKKNKKIDF